MDARSPNLRVGKVVGFVATFVVLCAISLAVAAPMVSGERAPLKELMTGLIAGACALVLTGTFVKVEHIGWRDVGVAMNRGSLQRFLGGLAIGIAIVLTWAMAMTLVGVTRWVRASVPAPTNVLLAFAAYVALAGREELAFRGYPLSRLDVLFGRVVAIMVVAGLFILEHRLGGARWIDALIGVGTGSVLFSLSRLASNGLAQPLGIHAAWNFGQWSLGLKTSPGIWSAAVHESTRSSQVGLALYVVLMVGASGAILWRERRRKLASAA